MIGISFSQYFLVSLIQCKFHLENLGFTHWLRYNKLDLVLHIMIDFWHWVSLIELFLMIVVKTLKIFYSLVLIKFEKT